MWTYVGLCLLCVALCTNTLTCAYVHLRVLLCTYTCFYTCSYTYQNPPMPYAFNVLNPPMPFVLNVLNPSGGHARARPTEGRERESKPAERAAARRPHYLRGPPEPRTGEHGTKYGKYGKYGEYGEYGEGEYGEHGNSRSQYKAPPQIRAGRTLLPYAPQLHAHCLQRGQGRHL
jgi:hypothetical protein